ncbi:hypothetical protein [Desulfovibrio cuneatus]|uniref:hypothetical protein n=1 Tax=Desulfovibrio cuneatus TaxID=159728 RepID=UPI000487A4E2|nr:hypothetical protein [Desulfovibrio cuneatus]
MDPPIKMRAKKGKAMRPCMPVTLAEEAEKVEQLALHLTIQENSFTCHLEKKRFLSNGDGKLARTKSAVRGFSFR